jgi:hypothetical protein
MLYKVAGSIFKPVQVLIKIRQECSIFWPEGCEASEAKCVDIAEIFVGEKKNVFHIYL